MKQPRKDVLREQLVLAAKEIIALNERLLELWDDDAWTRAWNAGYAARASERWWHRFAWWRA